MDKYEVEPHHIIFAIASVITSMIFSVLLTATNLGTTELVSLIAFIVVLLLMVKLLSMIITVAIFSFVKDMSKIFWHKNIDQPKIPLGSGDISLNAAVIITGFIVFETYKLLIGIYPIIPTDYLYKILTIIVITPIIFMIAHFFTKYVPPNDIF